MEDKINEAFGFKVELVSTKEFEAYGETRTRITVKRPNGKKFYHAVRFENGVIEAC